MKQWQEDPIVEAAPEKNDRVYFTRSGAHNFVRGMGTPDLETDGR